jgi:iron complex outermembrane receptor protein
MPNHFQFKYSSAKKIPLRLFMAALIFSCFVPTVAADQTDTIPTKSLFELSLDELLDLEVSVVTRSNEHIFEVPSALYVVTAEDIRRSGMQSIPELLRMVPGLHVGRLDANKWAISSRGPNRRFSHDILVLMDGRTLYNPLTNGVFWDTVDTVIEDIERIEIIRGPGASLWGVNSANGIINIVTKNAADTQGGLLTAGISEGEMKNLLSLRYGFNLSSIKTKVYGKVKNIDRYRHPNVSEQSHNTDSYSFRPYNPADDDSDFMQAGFRSDWERTGRNVFTLQGDAYDGDEDEIRTLSDAPQSNQIDVSGHNLLFRWKHDIAENSYTTVQIYYDHTEREDDKFSDDRDTYDVDLQHNFSKAGHNVTWGAGYRYIDNDTKHTGNVFIFALDPPNRDDDVISAFFHDQYQIIQDQLILSLGSKFEYNDYTDFEYQPSVKLLFKNEGHVLWGSVSRAVSTPSRTAADAYLDLNGFASICTAVGGTLDARLGCVNLISDKNIKSNVIISSELGYRWRPRENLFLDIALFYDDYDIKNSEANQVDYIYGLESNIKYSVIDDWKLEFSYTYNDGEDADPARHGVNQIPEHTFIARSLYNLGPKIELDIFYTYVDEITRIDDTTFIPDYSRLDLRLGYKFNNDLYLSILGSNLLDKHHTEANTDSLKANTAVERAIQATVSYQF